MIKDVLLKTLQQKKDRDTYFTVWSWIFANSNEQNIYYGTMKDILENCLIDYTKLNKCFELQYQWNKPEFEKTIILRKDDAYFKPIFNFNSTERYFKLFNINLKMLPSPYRPLIVIFNPDEFSTLENKSDIKQSLQIGRTEKTIDLELQKSESIASNPLQSAKSVKSAFQLASPAGGLPVTTANTKTNGQVKKTANTSHLPVKLSTKQMKEIKKQTEWQLVQACLTCYINFYKQRHDGMAPPQLSDKVASVEINAIKKMITYFRKNNKEGHKGDADILNSVDIIFRNWDKYPAYYQSKILLREIWSNLGAILGFIKNNHKQMHTSKVETVINYEKTISNAINSGTFDEIIANLGKPLHEKQNESKN